MSGVGRARIEGFLAIAGLSARSAMRSRLFLGSGGLVVLTTIFFAAGLSGDGTASGALQAFLSWSVEFYVFVLSLTTIFLSTALAGNLREGRLVQVCAAPLRREALLVSWWSGTAVALLLLVGIAFGTLYVSAQVTVLLAEEGERESLASVLQARGKVRPIPPDPERIRANAEATFEQLERSGRVPEGLARTNAIERLERSVRTRLRTVPRRQRIQWRVPGVRPTPGAPAVAVRFRYQAQALDRAWLGERPSINGAFVLAAPGSDREFTIPGKWVAGEVQEIAAPVEVLAGGSDLLVSYVNLERRPVVVLFPEHGVDVLYASGGFTANVARGALVLLGRLLFLAAVGAVAASLIDGRLAAGVVLWFLVMGSGSGFVIESMRPGLFGAVDVPLQALLKTILAALPDLGREDLAGLLAMGQRVDVEAVVRSVGLDGLGRGGLLLAAGALAFARRELGATRE